MNNGNRNYGIVTDSAPVAKTTHGMVRGENRDGVAIFRGIPYGADTSYEHRFLAPRPAEDWDGIRDCTKNGHIAVQMGSSIAGDAFFGPHYSGGHPEKFGVLEEEYGEDCLVANVLTPGTDEKRRPVIVYIHGGGFSSNSGSMVLGGDRLVREEDLVLVGVNHRLSIFGYLYLGAFDEKYAESGNAGMLDLVLALEWVRDNIAFFGGDPQNVTLLGESGGGMKINTLMAMEKARGLFKRAIMQSGTREVDGISLKQAEKMASEALGRLGVSKEDLSPLFTMSKETLIGATGGFGNDGFGPVADNIHIMNHGGKIRAWEGSEGIPVILGCAEEEMSLFSPRELLEVSDEQLRNLLLKNPEGMMTGSVFSLPEKHVDEVISVFCAAQRKQMSADHIYQRILSMGTFLGGASWYLAKERVKAGCAPVYQYEIRYETEHPGYSGKKYAWHTAELPWVMRIVGKERDEKISKEMAHAFAQFARTGSPSSDELPWPEFNEREKCVMVFDDDSHVEKDPLKAQREVLEKAGIHF